MTQPAFPGLAEMVASAQAGDPKAIDDLLARVQPDIRRYARRSCRLEDVDDAVQSALMTLSERVGALRVVASFAGWLFVIAKRECLRLARQTFPNWLPIDAMDNTLEFSDRPELELRQDLVAALESLPAHYRSIVLLRDFEEQTIAEIARSEQLSQEAVKARLRRARVLLREYLS